MFCFCWSTRLFFVTIISMFNEYAIICCKAFTSIFLQFICHSCCLLTVNDWLGDEGFPKETIHLLVQICSSCPLSLPSLTLYHSFFWPSDLDQLFQSSTLKTWSFSRALPYWHRPGLVILVGATPWLVSHQFLPAGEKKENRLINLAVHWDIVSLVTVLFTLRYMHLVWV